MMTLHSKNTMLDSAVPKGMNGGKPSSLVRPPKITLRHLRGPAARIRELVEIEVNRLDTYCDMLTCDVVVEKQHRSHDHGRVFHVRIEIGLPDEHLVVSRDPGPDETHQDLGMTLKQAFQAARRLVRDHGKRSHAKRN